MRGWTERTEATPWPALTETACHPESWKGSRRWCKVPMLPSGLAEVVADEEDLARFLTQSSHFNTEIVKPAAVRAALLTVEPNEPPPRHAAILGWPWMESDPELQRAKQKELALLIVSAAGAPELR